MRLGYRISLGVIAILMVMCMFVGSSYALWTLTSHQTSTNLIESGCFSVQFNDENSDSINLTNTYPMDSTKGIKKVTPYTFTVKNTCTVDAKYTIYLNSLEVDGKKLSDDFIQYALTESGNSLIVAKDLETTTKNTDKSHFTFTKGIVNSYIIKEGVLKGATSATADDGESITYDLRLWIKSNAGNEIFGQKFEAGISTIAKATKIETPETNSSTETTLETDTTSEENETPES